jgi:hypothetical protein
MFSVVKSPMGLGFIPVRGFSTGNFENVAEAYKMAVTDSFPGLEAVFKNLSLSHRLHSNENFFPLFNYWHSTHAENLANENFDQTQLEEEMLNYIRYVKKEISRFGLAQISAIFEVIGVFRNSHFKSRLFLNLLKFVESSEFTGPLKTLLADPNTLKPENAKVLINILGLAMEYGVKYDVIEVFLTAIKNLPVDKEMAHILVNHPLIPKIRRNQMKQPFWDLVGKHRMYLKELIEKPDATFGDEDVNYVINFASFFHKLGGFFENDLLENIFQFAGKHVEQIEPKNIPAFLHIFSSLAESPDQNERNAKRAIFQKLLDRYLENSSGLEKINGFVAELMFKNRLSKFKDVFVTVETHANEISSQYNAKYVLHHLKYFYPRIWNQVNERVENKLDEAYQKCIDRIIAKQNSDKKNEHASPETDLSPLLEAVELEFEKNVNVAINTFSYQLTNFQDFLEKFSDNQELKNTIDEYMKANPNTMVGLQILSNRHVDPYNKKVNSLYYFQRSMRIGLEVPIIGLDLKNAQVRYLLRSENPDQDLKVMLLKAAETWLNIHKKNLRIADEKSKKYQEKRTQANDAAQENSQE